MLNGYAAIIMSDLLRPEKSVFFMIAADEQPANVNVDHRHIMRDRCSN